MSKAPVLVLSGDGINCERETARAFDLAGAQTKIIHINDLLESKQLLASYKALALPGGFSFGDDLGSGQILALKMSLALGDHLREFVEARKPIIGICNGFQALTKLGLLPQPFAPRTVALGRNAQGQFLNRWVHLEIEAQSKCIWTRTLAKKGKEVEMPVRHGEGRICFPVGQEEDIHHRLTEAGQIPLRYVTNVNGSYGRIAGLCDPSGLIFGLMPHPEAAISPLLYPRKKIEMHGGVSDSQMEKGWGYFLFQDCVEYLANS